MIMNRLKIGDIVRYQGDDDDEIERYGDKIYEVTSMYRKRLYVAGHFGERYIPKPGEEPDWLHEYFCNIQCVDDPDDVGTVTEGFLFKLPKQEKSLFENTLVDNDYLDRDPKFRVGDVVELNKFTNYGLFTIDESIRVENEVHDILYGVVPLSEEGDVMWCPESQLTMIYHDPNYISESVGNNLPAWRGQLYNLFELTDRITDKEAILYLKTDMDEDTLPPARMAHILIDHSIYYRIDDMLLNSRNKHIGMYKRILKDTFGYTDEDISNIRLSIKDKIVLRNTTGTDEIDRKKNVKDKYIKTFTEEELLFVSKLDEIDISDEKIKDHYPVKMTNYQIMYAIREAYGNARKIGKRKIHSSDDKDELSAPVKGKVTYEGKSEKYGLVIQFIFNFDRNLIETAYPVRMNNNAKKYISEAKEGYEPFMEMATIARKKLSVVVNEKEPGSEHPYFKVYNRADASRSTGVAKLHFKDNLGEYHYNDPLGIYQWMPGKRESAMLNDLLSNNNSTYNEYTNWQVACFQWNYENGLIPNDIKSYMEGSYDDIDDEMYVQSTQNMPSEWIIK